MKQYTHDDLRELSNDEVVEIFEHYFPKAGKEVCGAINKLNRLIKQIETVFPDANYYLANDSFHLLVGKDSTTGSDSYQNLSIVAPLLHGSGGGDW